MTPEQVLKLAALLSQKIKDRRGEIATNVSYYKGAEGRMKFASDEFKDYFEKRFRGFSDNWCAPVAQAPIERINHLGIRFPQESTFDPKLARIWERNDADRGLSEALLMTSIAKRSFALVSPSPVGARITFEHPDSAAVIFDAQTRERRAGLAIWQDDTTEYASLYLPNEVLSLRREKRAIIGGDRYVSPDADGWEFDDRRGVSIKNPLGVVPLVEFRNQALLDDDPMSDIAGVMAMQDSINLVWAYLLNGLDSASLPARVVTNAEVPKEPILDENGVVIGSRPIELDRLVKDRITFLPGENVRIAEWSAANLDVYSKVIEHAIEHIAAQTRTPAHYLIAGGNTPATGYELAEAGLVSKATERTNYATPNVREIYRLSALAEGDKATAAKIVEAKILWKKPQFRSESQLMDGLGKMRTAGFPFQWIAEEYGLSPSDVERVMQMVKDEASEPYLPPIGAPDVLPIPTVVG